MSLVKKNQKAMEGISRKIWCSNWETGRCNENLETPGKTGRVGRCQFSQTYQLQDYVPGFIY